MPQSNLVSSFDGIPTFFRACCREARTQRNGYAGPGYHLAIGLAGMVPYDCDDDDWQEELNKLEALLSPTDPGKLRDDNAVWEWFASHYPKCMALVPRRRREQFLKGVYQALDDDRIF